MFTKEARIVIEIPIYPTEDQSKVEKAFRNIFGSLEYKMEKRVGINYLIHETDDLSVLDYLYSKIRDLKYLDTVRRQLKQNKETENNTILYLNKQAAYVGRVSLIELEDDPPLGAISIIFISEDLDELIDWFAPATIDGKIPTDGQES